MLFNHLNLTIKTPLIENLLKSVKHFYCLCAHKPTNRDGRWENISASLTEVINMWNSNSLAVYVNDKKTILYSESDLKALLCKPLRDKP